MTVLGWRAERRWDRGAMRNDADKRRALLFDAGARERISRNPELPLGS